VSEADDKEARPPMAVQLSAGTQPISGRVTKFRYKNAIDNNNNNNKNNNNNTKFCQ
jgi:hypothetical protein